MSDDKKLTLSGRKTLGVRTTVESGKVRQSFSHGRSKNVVVEVKRKRVLKKAGDDAPAPKPEEAAAPLIAPKPEKQTPPPPPPPPADTDGLTAGEVVARQEAAKAAMKQAEEERRRAAEEARRRLEEEKLADAEREKENREANRRQEKVAAPEPVVEDDEDESDFKRRKREEIRKKEAKVAPVADPATLEASEEDASRRRREPKAKKKVEVAKPVVPRRVDDRRRSGKLSVTMALGDDEGTRMRSMAALRRARAKERRAQQAAPSQPKKIREVVVPETITVQELANRMAEKAVDVIRVLMGMDVMATINQSLDQDTAELVVAEFGHSVKRVSDADVEIGMIGEKDAEEDMQPRPPVVTVMGHVDHGKTSLLDAIRKADVVSGEAGGITQHIGAYQVTTPKGDKVTFLDTPGHEAFTAMRARGASVTDIVILVVAADDGLMPQTIEAINHARAAKVPMIVAINKIDKDGANPQKVRQDLLQHEVIVESMSGETLEVEVSALKGTNIDKLLELIALQSEILEVKANPDRGAEGVVIESQLDKGRGPVATVLISRGTLRVGDIFVAGTESGKVRALIDDRGQQIKEAGPSQPVEILGLDGAPAAGDDFAVVESDARAREIASYRRAEQRKKRSTMPAVSFESMFSKLKENQAEEYPVLVKGDVQGSVEAISNALTKLGNDDIRVRVLHAAVGGISETDITLAAASNAAIIGFNVRANKQARESAESQGVPIKYYSVIYHLVDDVKAAMAGQLGPEIIENVIGTADIRDVFSAGKAGRAAGCHVVEGSIRKSSKARILRDGVIVYTGKITNLRRFKDDVEEVRNGLECGMTFENFTDMKPGDQVESYVTEERERKL